MSDKKEKAVVQKTTAASNENLEVKDQNAATPNEDLEVKEEVKSVEVNGKKYTLSDRCKTKLQVDGVVYTKEELLNNEEVMETLVVANSPFIKRHI
jgi:hypothetical protein